MVTVSQLQRRK